MTLQILDALKEKKIVDLIDLERLFFGMDLPQGISETKKFVLTRLSVLFDNLIASTTEVDSFDFLSQILLTNYQQILANKKEPL